MTSGTNPSSAEQLALLLQAVRSPDSQESPEEIARRELGQQRLKERLSLIPWYREQARKDGEDFWRKLHGSCILS